MQELIEKNREIFEKELKKFQVQLDSEAWPRETSREWLKEYSKEKLERGLLGPFEDHVNNCSTNFLDALNKYYIPETDTNSPLFAQILIKITPLQNEFVVKMKKNISDYKNQYPTEFVIV